MKPIHLDSYAHASFSFGNRAARSVWSIVYWCLVWPSPKPLHAWRAMVYRLFGASIGRGVHIYPGARVWAPWNLHCGAQVGIANGAIVYNQAPVRIGRRAVISQGAHLCAGTHDYNDPGLKLVTKPIVIGEYAWVAAEVFVHPGVTIGKGAVIGARSVVTKDMPEWMVCVGHPCRPLKPRDGKTI